MKFEELATELLLEIFQWIDLIDLFRAFYGLNSRLNNLIFIQYQIYHLNFQSVTKEELHFICQRHLPSIANQVISLELSDDEDEKSNLLEMFLSYGFTFDQFYHLESLSLAHIHSLPLLNRILSQCQDLLYFTHLSIRKCNFKEQDHSCHWIAKLWKLPKLIHCRIDHRFLYGIKFHRDTIISPSIKYLSLQNFRFDFNDLSNLFYCTPSLRYFNATIQSHSDCAQLRVVAPFLKLLNLNRLTLKNKDIYLDGYDWMKIIRTSFPKLKIFQLKMDFRFSHLTNAEERLDELINSFRCSFWTEEHQWFVRCDWISTSLSDFGTLYTLSYAFEEFLLTNKTWSKSTASIDNEYDRVHTLTVMNLRTNALDCSSGVSDHFRNVQHLCIHLPLKDAFWSLIHSLNQLISLDVMLFEGISSHPLQLLLDRSPRLSSLCLGNFNHLQIIAQLTSVSISRLDFLTKNTYKRYADRRQCDTLVNSSLARRCQVLLISVENRRNILQLLKSMSNLRSVTFQCKDDTANDELVQWFRDHLPATCSVFRDRFQKSNIRLCIDQSF